MNKNNNSELKNWDQLRKGHSSEELQEIWDLSGKFGQSYTPDVEKGLARLHGKLATEPTTAKRIQLHKRRTWLRVAAAIIGLGLLGGWWYQQQQGTVDAEWVVVATTEGEQRELVLPDGSEVILNEHTRLSYRSDLATAETRELELRGEAYFDVKRAPEQPFHIHTTGAEVSVLGTAFNLKAPADGQSAELAVTHGLVAFHPRAVEEMLMVEKGGLATWSDGEEAILERSQATDNYRAWHSRSLQFQDASLVEVLTLLSRTYNIQFKHTNQSASLTCHLTGRWEKLSLTDAMVLLGELTGLEVEAINTATYRLAGQCEG